MKPNFTKKAYGIKLLFFFFLISFSATSQVGINTTTPAGGSMLDVETSDKGILIPRVDIADLSTIAPVTGGSTTSLLVYNSNTTTGPGFFYWNGSIWVGIDGDDDWKLVGNAGTTPGTGVGQNYVGTSDAQNVIVASNGSAVATFSTNGQVRASNAGTVTVPSFSFDGDTNTGLFNSSDILNFTSGGTEFAEMNANGAMEFSINDDSADINTRVETDGNANMLYIDGGNNNIGVGTATPNGLLDMVSSTMGMIPPRVALTSTIVEAPVVNPQGGSILAGTCVYNTNTAGSAPNNVAPGLYFWNGSRWVAFAGSPGGLDWTLTGNSGTTAATNFLGTTDAVDLVFRTNNAEEMRITSAGEVVVNGTVPAIAGDSFTSFSSGTARAITASNTGTGAGIFSTGSGGGVSIWGATTASISAYVGDNDRIDGNGIISSGAGALLAFFPGTGMGGLFTGTNGSAGIATSAIGTGVQGLGQGRLTSVTNSGGSGISGSGNTLGVYGYTGFGDVANANRGNAAARFNLDADNDVTTITGNFADRAQAILAGFNNVTPDGVMGNQDSYFGGYFSGGNQGSGTPSYAYAGMRYNTNANGTAGTDYKIIGTGTNSTLINDENNVPHIMFSPESPEIVFQDYGVGQLVNGEVRINLDPILSRNIRVDAQHPMKVFVTLEGDCKGIYVTDKSAQGFTVKELQGGTSNISFSWQIVANREDTKNNRGQVTSKHVGLRLPVGPGAIKSPPSKANKISKVENSNVPVTSNNVKSSPQITPQKKQ